ncbi:MAG: crotonase/enoyl-CoA hydratase family protein [Lautropia sp.]
MSIPTKPPTPDAPSAAATAHPLQAALDLLALSRHGSVLHLQLDRPAKRNALSDTLVDQIHTCMINLPPDVKAVVISGAGEHFCAGLDLAELADGDIGHGVRHSRRWHAAFDAIQFGSVPVVAALHGAVVGGGLELAVACHVRVAATSTYYALPEGQRGIFVGGGGSVRIPRLIGVSRMTDMMLTGRVHDAESGLAIGLSQYVVDTGTELARALELASKIATNAPMSNYAVMHALPRIADQSQADGLMTESLMAAIAQSTPEAKGRLRAFLDGKAAKVGRS